MTQTTPTPPPTPPTKPQGPHADAVPLPMVACLKRPDGRIEPAQFLLSREDVIDLLRLADSGTKFPKSTLDRYRKLGLRSHKIGRRVWIRLDELIAFLDAHHTRLRVGKAEWNRHQPYVQ